MYPQFICYSFPCDRSGSGSRCDGAEAGAATAARRDQAVDGSEPGPTEAVRLGRDTEISLKGEVKKRDQKDCKYGPDGKVRKTPLTSGAAPQAEPGGGRRGRRGGAII